MALTLAVRDSVRSSMGFRVLGRLVLTSIAPAGGRHRLVDAGAYACGVWGVRAHDRGKGLAHTGGTTYSWRRSPDTKRVSQPTSFNAW